MGEIISIYLEEKYEYSIFQIKTLFKPTTNTYGIQYPFMGFFESHKWVWACHGYRDKAFLTRTHSSSYERFKKSEKTEVKKKKK
mgnify:FL=1